MESLYNEFAPAGYAFALQLTQDSDAAQDLVQNVFLRLARRPRFTILNPRSFVLRCIYRAHLNVVRRDATRRQMLKSFALEAQTPFRPELGEDEKIAALLKQLAALPKKQRVVVHLKTWEQTSFGQTTSTLASKPAGGDWTVTTTNPDGTSMVQAITNIRQTSTVQKASGGRQSRARQ